MPTFGADPDLPEKDWEMSVSTPRYVSRPVRELTNYFAYHKNMRMSQRCDEDDKVRLNVLFSRRLKQGFSAESIKAIIDKFFQTPEGQTAYPAPLFCTNDVQATLVEGVEMRANDSVLQWLVDGMPNNDDLFDDSREVRKAVLLTCDEALFRYPTVVAEILRGDSREFHSRLTALEGLIKWNLGEENDVDSLHESLGPVMLPKVLTTRKRSPKMLASRKPTVQLAVASETVKKRQEDW